MSEPLIQSVLAGVPLPVLLIDDTAQIQHANARAIEMLGHDPGGLNALTLLRQADIVSAIDLAMQDRQPASARFVHSGLSGEVTYSVLAHPFEKDAGRIWVVLSFEDTSRQEASDLIRRDFIANISHELRTPLTGLTGFIETLKTTARDDPETRARFLDIMEMEAQRMGRMVSDLLSLSRVEADERVRPRAQVNVSGVLRSVIATLEGKLKARNLKIALSGAEDPALVAGDRDQLIQLFLNLIENAIKYAGSDRTIHVTLHTEPHDRVLRGPAIRIDVRDEGPGIDPLHLPRLTERFYRIDDHRSREMGGTGLGLAIAKHIVNRHRGRLKIASEQGVGSTFSVIFPTG